MNIQPQEEIYDIIISGLGAYGSSALYHASKQNKKVLGIERYTVGNDKGSSYGETRITRQNIFEGVVYPQIAQKSQKLVYELEKQSGQKLQFFKGGLWIGQQDSNLIQSMLLNEKLYGLDLKKLNASQINEKYPVFKATDDFMAVIDGTSGFCYNEKIIKIMVDIALQNTNTQIKENTEVISYVQEANYIRIKTDKGQFLTKKLILAEGARMVNLLRELGAPVYLQKNQAAWLKWNSPHVQPDTYPIMYWDYYSQKHQIYSFPNVGSGFKIGLHKRGQEYTDYRQMTQEVDEELLQELIEVTQKVFKTGKGGINWDKNNIDRIATCYYTMSPDNDFIVDYHPNNSNIVLLSCCSGHGFKHCPQIGLDAVEMTNDKNNYQIPYQEFRLNRFQFLNSAKL